MQPTRSFRAGFSQASARSFAHRIPHEMIEASFMREALRHLPLENQMSHASHASHTSHPQAESKARSTSQPHPTTPTNRKENKHDTKIHDCQGGGTRLRTAVLHRTRAARPRDVQARGVRIPLAEDGLPSGAAIERMRDKCGEAGSSLGATVKLTLSDGTELTRHVSFGE